MGLVAWTNAEQQSEPLKPRTVPPPAHVTKDPVVTKEVQSPLENSPDEDSMAVTPFVQWLVDQPLTPMQYKGAEIHCIGSEQASLLVICLYVESGVTLPLSRNSAQLFDLMMRAIEVPRTGYRQCAMPTDTQSGDSSAAPKLYLDDIITSQTRALLVLDSVPAQHPDLPGAEQAVPGPSSVPVFRVPHPDLLLTTPALKRQAWESLKVLRQVLDARAGR